MLLKALYEFILYGFAEEKQVFLPKPKLCKIIWQWILSASLTSYYKSIIT